MSTNYVVTYAGSEFIANAVAGSGKSPNCMYVVYSSSSTPTALTLNSDIDQYWFQNSLPSGCGFLIARNKTASRVSPHSLNSPVKATFSSLIAASDAQTTTPVFGAGSKIIGVALAYGEKLPGGGYTDTIIAVANVTVGGVFNPITYVANTSMSVSIPLNFEAAVDYNVDESSSESL